MKKTSLTIQMLRRELHDLKINYTAAYAKSKALEAKCKDIEDALEKLES